MTGIELIEQERSEQIEKHGIETSHDADRNSSNQLVIAAKRLLYDDANHTVPPVGWNNLIWSSLAAKPFRDRLVYAGALLAAELDRMEYAGCESEDSISELIEYTKPKK